MRLYIDSFLSDEAGGRPLPTTYGGETSGWERTFPRCWLRQNRIVLEDELRKRIRRLRSTREYDKLHWYLQFIEHPSLNASEQSKQNLRLLLEDAIGQNTLQQARRDWGMEAVEKLRYGFQNFAQGPVERLAGSSSEEFLLYLTPLWYYARTTLNLANGGTGNIWTGATAAPGRQEALTTWRQVLEPSHLRAILPPPRSTTSRFQGQIRRVLVSEAYRQLHRVARKVGFKYYVGGRDITETKLRELAEGI